MRTCQQAVARTLGSSGPVAKLCGPEPRDYISRHFTNTSNSVTISTAFFESRRKDHSMSRETPSPPPGGWPPGPCAPARRQTVDSPITTTHSLSHAHKDRVCESPRNTNRAHQFRSQISAEAQSEEQQLQQLRRHCCPEEEPECTGGQKDESKEPPYDRFFNQRLSVLTALSAPYTVQAFAGKAGWQQQA